MAAEVRHAFLRHKVGYAHYPCMGYKFNPHTVLGIASPFSNRGE